MDDNLVERSATTIRNLCSQLREATNLNREYAKLVEKLLNQNEELLKDKQQLLTLLGK